MLNVTSPSVEVSLSFGVESKERDFCYVMRTECVAALAPTCAIRSRQLSLVHREHLGETYSACPQHRRARCARAALPRSFQAAHRRRGHDSPSPTCKPRVELLCVQECVAPLTPPPRSTLFPRVIARTWYGAGFFLNPRTCAIGIPRCGKFR